MSMTPELVQQLRGRAAFLRDRGEIKSPELMECAADAIATQPHSPDAADSGRVVIDFGGIGSAGPFPIIDGKVMLPDVTLVDFAHRMQPTLAARGPGSEYEAGHTHGWAECAEAVTHSNAVVSPVVTEVLLELDRATKKFPTWPDDPLHAVGVLNEEVGELNKAVLQQVYEPHKNTPGSMRSEAVQAAAMALRFINSIDRYVFAGGSQHEQNK